MRICVVGDSGLLGQAVTKRAIQNGDLVYGISSSEFQKSHFWNLVNQTHYRHEKINLLKDKNLFLKQVDNFKPDLLVNCVALVDLWLCEKNPELAKVLNIDTAEFLANFCTRRKISFIYISTDQVFDGTKKGSYTEEDLPLPIHVYGKSKWLGEEKVCQTNDNALILRTNIVGFRDRPGQPTFAEWICRALKEKSPIFLAEDFVTSSMHVEQFAQLMFSAHKEGLKGLYHIASSDGISKYEFGRRLAEKLEISFVHVKKSLLKNLNLIPPRPSNVVLNVKKAETALNIAFPKVDETIKQLAKDFNLRSTEAVHA